MKHDFSAMVYPSSLLPPVQLRDKRPRTRINWKESHKLVVNLRVS